MATKSETNAFTLIGAGLSVLAGYNEAKKNNRPFTFEQVIGHAAIGAFGGRVFAEVAGEPNDTVNYTCHHKGKVVYCGVTYEDRLEARKAEHRKSGKRFDRVTCSSAKPRSEALAHEKKMIKRHKPKYNNHHNIWW